MGRRPICFSLKTCRALLDWTAGGGCPYARSCRRLTRLILHARSRHQPATDRRLRHFLALHIGDAFHAAAVPTPYFHIDLDPQRVTGNHGTPEARALDSSKENQLFVSIFKLAEQQHAAGLRHRLDDQYARHDRQIGKVSRKKWLIDCDILNSHDALLADQFNNPINQQERITMRQNLENIVNIQRRLRGGFVDCSLSSVHLSYPVEIDDYTVRQVPDNTKGATFLALFARSGIPQKSCNGCSSQGKMTRKISQHSSRAIPPADPEAYLNYFAHRKDEIVETTQRLVEIESPSDVKQAVDRLGAVLAGRFDAIGGKVIFHVTEKFGNHLQVDFPAEHAAKPILLLGHLDTVYRIGTIAKMPSRVADGRVWGPGVLDMKSGIALMLHALEALRNWNGKSLPRPIKVLLVSDEEVGSESSRMLTEKLARQSAAVLVLEPAYGPKGAVKTARKGVGEYGIKITGKAAHAGLDFEKGESAIIELARQIIAISEMVDLKRGTTLNAGIVRGGTRTNVIPDEASAFVDVRVPTTKDAAAIHKRLMQLRPSNPNCKIEVLGGMNRPPMERTPNIAALYKKSAHIARELGWDLEEAAVGGGSDGNFTAALGIPTLDGLGGVGEGAHADHESVVISELPRRAALLTRLIQCV